MTVFVTSELMLVICLPIVSFNLMTVLDHLDTPFPLYNPSFFWNLPRRSGMISSSVSCFHSISQAYELSCIKVNGNLLKDLISKFSSATFYSNRLSKYWDNAIWFARITSARSSSPDLSRLEFFLWDDSKEKVYQGNPQSVTELKKSTAKEIRSFGSTVQ